MPVIAPGSKILVSGANAFIAVWLIRSLLEQGYSVRGTVRSMEKSAFLVDMFKSYDDKFELVVVEDITKVGGG
jgi:nucleoside-diphosphate-sugar epimerase